MPIRHIRIGGPTKGFPQKMPKPKWLTAQKLHSDGVTAQTTVGHADGRHPPSMANRVGVGVTQQLHAIPQVIGKYLSIAP